MLAVLGMIVASYSNVLHWMKLTYTTVSILHRTCECDARSSLASLRQSYSCILHLLAAERNDRASYWTKVLDWKSCNCAYKGVWVLEISLPSFRADELGQRAGTYTHVLNLELPQYMLANWADRQSNKKKGLSVDLEVERWQVLVRDTQT